MAETISARQQASVGVLARNGGRVLLVKTNRGGPWSLVPGVVMPGETPLEAAWRELWEKTGLYGRFGAELGAATRNPLASYRERRVSSDTVVLDLTFLADVPEIEIALSDDLVEARWMGSVAEIDPPDPWIAEIVRGALEVRGSAAVEIARSWLAAVKAGDLDALVALYGADAEHSSPELRSSGGFQPRFLVKGTDSIRGWWTELLQSLPGLRYEEQSVTWNENRALVECLRVLPGTPEIRMALSITCEGGRIVSTYVYRS